MKLAKKSVTALALPVVLLLGAIAVSVIFTNPEPVPKSGAHSTMPPPSVLSRPETSDTTPPVSSTVDHSHEAQAEPVESSGSLAISGSVLNQQGELLADLTLIAAPSRIFTNDTEKQATQLQTISNAAGHYRFAGLMPGDYSISNEATSHYPATRIKVRAGADQANLVLSRRQDLWIYGVVKEDNQPLAGVQIGPGGEPSDTTYSDTNGSFGIYLAVHGDAPSQDSLYFSLAGYHKKRVLLRVSDPYAKDLALGDVRLERHEGQALVRGSVTAKDAPVANARVFLRSTERSDYYDTTTDAGGYFAMQDVVIGDYEITVVPRSQYQDYTNSEITINESSLELRISLEVLDNSAVLRGRMVDVSGSPVPGFSLWLTNLSARARGGLPVAGDARGMFEVENLPAGELVFTTRSNPRLRITGAAVGGPSGPPLELVLDVGDNILSGQVVDAYSNPVPGAQVSLAWSHETGEISSHALRNTTADTSGNFRFSQLGPGAHTLTVSAFGYQRRRVEHDVGTDVQIKLTTLSH